MIRGLFLAVAALVASAAGGPKPDFSGHWVLSSALGTTPVDGLALEIQQIRDALQIKATWQNPSNGQFGLTLLGIVTPLARFTMGGQEDLNQVGPFVLHSRTHWVDDRLVTTWNTSEFQGHRYHGTWTRSLSEDGGEQTLLIEGLSGNGLRSQAVLKFRKR